MTMLIIAFVCCYCHGCHTTAAATVGCRNTNKTWQRVVPFVSTYLWQAFGLRYFTTDFTEFSVIGKPERFYILIFGFVLMAFIDDCLALKCNIYQWAWVAAAIF